MDLGLTDKSAVVLASSSGLGFAVAEALLAEGCRVAISGRDPARLAHAHSQLTASQNTNRVISQVLDVTDHDALAAHLTDAYTGFGSLDILILNAGGPPTGLAQNTSDDDLARAFDLTLRSAIHAVRIVLPWMRTRRWGRIIAMTSSSVRHPIPRLALSNTMRPALTGWLKTLSAEVAADGILVNTICTGMFATSRFDELLKIRAASSGKTVDDERRAAESLIPVRRLGDPREFGAMVAFMASEKASFLCGASLSYDGGASTFLL